ncbi:aldehyde dehydrogenase family protein [Actinoallomurus acanthiterrae]
MNPPSRTVANRWSAPDARVGQIVDPATGQPLRTVAESDPATVDAAVRSADAALRSWRHRPPQERSRLLLEVAVAIREAADEIAALESEEVGKPFTQARQFDLEMCISSFEYFAGLLADPPARARHDGSIISLTTLDPYGVVAGVLPFNWPPIHTAAKTAPALAAGNAVVLKPPEQAPSAVLRLVEIISGRLPDDVVHAVCGGPGVGSSLVGHPLVRKVSFTGSPEGGRAVARDAAANLTPALLELGGKNALIVLADADLDAAVAGAVEGSFFNQGEACTAASRLVVDRRIHDEFVERLARAVRRLIVGHPSCPDVHVGPLVSARQQQRVLAYLAIAQSEGAKVAAQAPLPDDPALTAGFWVPPTLLTGVTPDMRVAQEEIFGPVACVIPFDSAEEAVEIANGTPFALVASVYGQDSAETWRVAQNLDAGIVFINNYHRSILGTPFGGNRESGYGREHSPETLLAFGRSKSYRFPSGLMPVPRWFAVDDVTGGDK